MMSNRESAHSSSESDLEKKHAPNSVEDTSVHTSYADSSIDENDLHLIETHLQDRSYEECMQIVDEAIERHRDDSSVDAEYFSHLVAMNEANKQLGGHPPEAELEYRTRFAAFLIHDWSIYPSVRAATRPIDEVEEECETFRAYVLAVIWAGAGACLDTFFANRYPSISLSGISLQIMIVGTGKMWALLPRSQSKYWRWFNPGPWGFKEQMLASAGVQVAAKSPYVLYSITAQRNQEFFGFTDGDFGYSLLMLLSTTFMGFGMAGVMRVFLVYPVEAIWYQILPNISLNRALVRTEIRENINGWRIKRGEAFWIFAWFSFGWYWITNFVFKALSYFDWMAWIKPNNVALQAMCGAHSGLALNIWNTFDWSNIDEYKGMIMPLWSQNNMFFGVIISFVAVVIVWFTNVRYTAYLPINSNSIYDNAGKKYDVARILGSQGEFREDKYRDYSLPYFTAGALVSYGCNFMIYTASASYSLLYHLPMIWRSLKLFTVGILRPQEVLNRANDRFSRAQRKYREVPEWWFFLILAVAFALSVVVVEVYKFTQTPVWSIVFAIGLATILMVPLALLYSLTGFQIDVNELCEIIIGLLLPGNANANMISKVYAVTFLNQTEQYVSTQKQSHYVGIPPRALFRVQVLCCLVAVFIQAGIIFWQVNGGIPHMCSVENNPARFTCQGSRSYFNAGVAWGTIGTAKIMQHVYPTLKWVFLIGAFVPVPLWLLRRYLHRHPVPALGWTRSINELTIIAGAKQWAPSSLLYTLPSWYICLFFNGFVRSRWPLWWAKYSHIIWAGMGVGLAYSALIMFFSTEYHHLASIKWWGNSVSSNNLDGSYEARWLPIPSPGYFGPTPGTLP